MSHSINTRITKLFIKTFSVSSPYRSLCTYLYYRSISARDPLWKAHLYSNVLFYQGLPQWIFYAGMSCFSAPQRHEKRSNGIDDNMQMLLFHNNFVKPWSAEHNLLCLLTCSFYLWCVLCVLLCACGPGPFFCPPQQQIQTFCSHAAPFLSLPVRFISDHRGLAGRPLSCKLFSGFRLLFNTFCMFWLDTTW